jgi:Papain fold toxin 2
MNPHGPAQQVASNAAKGFGDLQCRECANAVQRALRAAGHRGQLIDLRGGGKRGFIISRSLPLSAPAISQNGRHVGVRVGDLVFDNIYPDGMPYDQWINDFDAVGGVSVDSITDF